MDFRMTGDWELWDAQIPDAANLRRALPDKIGKEFGQRSTRHGRRNVGDQLRRYANNKVVRRAREAMFVRNVVFRHESHACSGYGPSGVSDSYLPDVASIIASLRRFRRMTK
jgi:hypothetical protein